LGKWLFFMRVAGFGGASPGLECAELLRSISNWRERRWPCMLRAVKALFAEPFDDHERRMGFGVLGDDVVVVLGKSEGEQVIFEPGDAV
jgi:hypothetical protein